MKEGNQYYEKENGGLSDARNAGMRISRGDIISFIDSDDWLVDNDVISDFVKIANEQNSDFVYGIFSLAPMIFCLSADKHLVIRLSFANSFFLSKFAILKPLARSKKPHPHAHAPSG